jgi:hypothetical protein
VFVIGVDSHKSSLALCVVDELGRAIAAPSVANSAKGHAAALAWLSEVLGQLVGDSLDFCTFQCSKHA